MTVITYKWTVDRYHQAVEAGIFNAQPLELLNGELIEMSPEGISHAALSSDLETTFANYWASAPKFGRVNQLLSLTTRSLNLISLY